MDNNLALQQKNLNLQKSIEALKEANGLFFPSVELNPNDFFRANRQYLISSKSVEKIHTYGNQQLKLTNKPRIDEGIIISKLKATAFKSWMGK